MSEEIKRKVGAQPGHVVSAETREKIRQIRLKNPIKYWLGKSRPDLEGHKWNVGSKHSPETKERMSVVKRGSKGPGWKGGKTLVKGYNWKVSGRAYRLRKRGAVGSHTFEQWQELKATYNFICLCCKQSEPWVELTRDHILPLSKGGTDDIKNIQPLCRSCNARKWTYSVDYRPEFSTHT